MCVSDVLSEKLNIPVRMSSVIISQQAGLVNEILISIQTLIFDGVRCVANMIRHELLT
jgi:hypothetical protein